jgi:DNA-binding transcriptional regulator YdaS (Cro superfamily)
MSALMRAIEKVIAAAGSQVAVQRRLRVSQSAVSQWLSGRTGIDPRHFPALVQLSRGRVSLMDLLNDEIKRSEQSARARARRRNASTACRAGRS